jgi:hypothetical protein
VPTRANRWISSADASPKYFRKEPGPRETTAKETRDCTPTNPSIGHPPTRKNVSESEVFQRRIGRSETAAIVDTAARKGARVARRSQTGNDNLVARAQRASTTAEALP